jgi:ATP-dependent 26S proteasome regulatory subunit
MLSLPTVSKKSLALYFDARFPILYIRTYEETKADGYIGAAAGARKVLEWNGANGLVDFRTKASLLSGQTPLESALNLVSSEKRCILVIKDAVGMPGMPTDILGAPKVSAQLKEIARRIRTEEYYDISIVIVSSILQIPPVLSNLITIMELDFPDEKEIHDIIASFMEDNGISFVNEELLEEMTVAFKGLSEFEISDLLGLAVSTDHDLTRNTLQIIFNQKQQMILKAGILEMIPLKESVADIGGLENLKDWLQKKAAVFKDIKNAMKFGAPMPKGVLIAGIPGCGKSLSAKAAGSLFDVPLLRLDMGRLMGKYVGESEENMRNAIRLAEAISPCILWVDELEKAFAGISGGGGEVTTRLFGTFLTWMQEKTSSTFVVATANDITKLPPELMRKGRFDEIFYVPLPNKEERKKIFEIHINKRRKQDTARIDISALVDQTEGYSGADIEGVVGESVESVFVRGGAALTTEDVQACIRNTHSLSEIMKEPLEEMDKMYNDRKFKKASK